MSAIVLPITAPPLPPCAPCRRIDWFFLGVKVGGPDGDQMTADQQALLPLLDSEYRWRDGSRYRCNRQMAYWEVSAVCS